MSVVVRMEMPTSCEECPLVQTDENDWGDVMSRTCNLIYKGYLLDVPKGERRADCPIICQLPEGHGRLVDEDALLRDIEKYHVSEGKFQHWLELQPTIVPAEAQRKVDAYDAVAPTDTPTDTPTVTAERSET